MSADFGTHYKWFIDPEFMLMDEEGWPATKSAIMLDATGEERTYLISKSKSQVLPNIDRFSAGFSRRGSVTYHQMALHPPGVPFMGGIWDQLVRAVKTACTAC